VNGTLFFTANNGTNGTELWKINANGGAEQVADINPNAASSYPNNLTNVNGTLFFSAFTGTNGFELWKINASGGAEQVADINPNAASSFPISLTIS
jgi:ELWxxDGT repeat protein